MRREFLSFSPPSIGPEEIEEVVATLKTDWITTGPKARRFEEALAAFVGAPGALAVSSATDALQVGLAALGIAEGGRGHHDADDLLLHSPRDRAHAGAPSAGRCRA